MQWKKCQHTRDTRQTGGSRVPREAAGACKLWHNLTSPVITCIHDASKA